MHGKLRALTGLAALLAAGTVLLPSAGATAAPAFKPPPANAAAFTTPPANVPAVTTPPANAPAVKTAPGLTTPPAKAAAATLPLPAFSDLEVGARYAFISGGRESDGIAVTDLAGREITKIAAGAGATGLALSRDGRTLYAALTEAGVVSAIDTRTLRERARYDTGTCPVHLAVTDRVWFGFGCGSPSATGIGSIDVGASPPAVKLGLQNVYYYAPLLAAARHANVLVAGETGLSPATVHSYQQGADGALTRLAAARDTVGSNLQDLAVTPNGSIVYTAAGWPYEINAFATSDLTPRGQLETTAYPNAVAVTPRGDRLAGGSDATYDPDVYLFKTSDGTRQQPIEIGSGLTLKPRGLAWGMDGRTLFAVSGGWNEAPALHVLSTTATATAAGAPAGRSTAALAAALPLPAFTGIAVGSRYVFTSGGGRANEIVVTDLDGRLVRKIPGQAGALSLALGRDGRTLYAVLKSTGTVSAIDTRTLRERARYVTRTCPSALAVTDRVWFGYGCGFGWNGGIGSIDVTAADPAVTLDHQASDYYSAPRLFTPRGANLVVAGDTSTSAQDLDVYEQATDGKLSRKVSGELATRHMALNPDGSTLYAASGRLKAYAVSDLSPRGEFDADAGTLALSRDAARIAGGSESAGAARVDVFATGDYSRQATFDLGAGQIVVGLAFSADGKRLYAVTTSSDWTSTVPTLHVLAA